MEAKWSKDVCSSDKANCSDKKGLTGIAGRLQTGGRTWAALRVTKFKKVEKVSFVFNFINYH